MTLKIQRDPRTILVAVALCPILAVSAISSARPAAADAPTPADLARLHAAYPGFTVVDSGRAQTQDGVKGQVRIGSSSRAAGAGVAVLVYEWPSRAKLAKQKVGTKLALTPVAATLTTSTGSYAVPSSVVGSKSAPENRDLLAVLANDPTAYQEFEVAPDGSPVEDSAAPSAVAVAEGQDASTLVAPTSRATIKTASTPAALTDATPDAVTGCQPPYTVLRQRWDQKVIAGHTKSTTDNVNTTLTFSSGASSTLGWGASVSGSAASYTSSGTKTLTSDTTVTFPSKTTAHDFFRQTYWEYGRYEVLAVCGSYYPGTVTNMGWQVKPIDFASGATYFKGATPSGTYCASYGKGSAFSKDETKAMTWTNGVSINTTYVDVDLSAQSGWSTKVKIGYSFARGAGSVCGTLAKPGATTTSPGDLTAK